MALDFKSKAIICVVPFLATAGVAFALAMPAYDEYNGKAKTVDDKKTEHEELQQKL